MGAASDGGHHYDALRGSVLFTIKRTVRFYRSAVDEIHMPPREAFPDAGKFYATALHELGHSTGHESRLNRKLGNVFGSEDYAKEELRAEMASFFSCRPDSVSSSMWGSTHLMSVPGLRLSRKTKK
ncbi:zincin-like metallopeptidase domain-containing protein [Undibacterium arcticum]